MKAAIDIGTNTALLLVAEHQNGVLDVIHEEQRVPRLGKDVDQDRVLSGESMKRVVDALKEYQQIISNKFPDVDQVIVTATSAVRDATNKNEFLALVHRETGFAVRILSGDEEATLTYSGALSTLNVINKTEVFVLDIGGGSTEVALGKDGKVKDEHSYDVGCVRFTERYLKENPPTEEQINDCRKAIKKTFQEKRFKSGLPVKAVGVAGTATSLAAIDLQIDQYEPERINNHLIDHKALKNRLETFKYQTHQQLLELNPDVLKGREDIFLAGLLIMDEFLELIDLDEIVVSTGGIRHGVLLEAFG